MENSRGVTEKVLRVLVWSTFFSPHVGGYEKNVLELSRRLVAQGKYSVTVVTCRIDNSAKAENIDGVEIKRVPCLQLLRGVFPTPVPSVALLRLLKDNNYDVIVTQTRFFALSALGAMSAKLHNIPLIHVERGSSHPVLTNPLTSIIGEMYDHIIGYCIMRAAKQVVGVSKAACTFAYHLGARRVIEIPNGINPVEDVALNPEANSILYVGRLIQAKGVHNLIQAYKELGTELPLLIAGTGPYSDRLLEVAGDNDNIHFLGNLSGEHLADAYRSARIFVNPSYSEGLPTSVMEAASFAIPVVATDVGGTGEVIQNGVTGQLIRPIVADIKRAILWILNHDSQARRMAEVGKERVLKIYSWDRVVEQYDQLLESARKHQQK